MSALTSVFAITLLGSQGPAPTDRAVVPESPPAAPQTSPDAPTGAARPLVLSVSGVSLAELRAALRLRLGTRELLDATAPRPTTTDFVDVAAREDGSVSYTLITAEGRAFDRTLAAEPDQLRALAAAIANLTFAIETGGIEPDRVDVPQPPAPAPEPAPEPVPEPAPEPVAAPVPEPPPKPTAAPPKWHLGTSLDAGVLLGVAPRTDAGALASGFGRLGVDLRHHEGGLFALGVRVAGRSRRSLTMLRARVDVGGGWAWRWQRFELLTAAALTIEPWWVREAGGAATLVLDDLPASRRPLLGALVRVAPGVLVPFGEADRHAVRIGPRLELAGSFVPQGGARSVDVARADGDGDLRSALRAGGFEIAIGLDVTLWLGLRRKANEKR